MMRRPTLPQYQTSNLLQPHTGNSGHQRLITTFDNLTMHVYRCTAQNPLPFLEKQLRTNMLPLPGYLEAWSKTVVSG